MRAGDVRVAGDGVFLLVRRAEAPMKNSMCSVWWDCLFLQHRDERLAGGVTRFSQFFLRETTWLLAGSSLRGPGAR